jgi:predicted TIM-barrel fold metal-dependent hydrolase
MVIDCHVHISAFTPGHGSMSRRLVDSLPFWFMRWRLGLSGEASERSERALERLLIRTLDATPELDAAVVLAFDAVHDLDGRLDANNTHLYVTNDYVIDLAQQYPKVLFGASVHPYRKDALAELERCVAAGAVLLKWLPIVQDFNPADPRCFPIYEAMAHYRLPLLCHTGGEKALPSLAPEMADPMLLAPAAKMGVTVIAAHCGARARRNEPDYVPQFIQLARAFENVYGDTSALNLPMRWYALEKVLANPATAAKLVHGSDWPIISLPSPFNLGSKRALRLMHEKNWMRRDVLIKQQMNLDRAYWHRAATLLRLPGGGNFEVGKK